MRRRLNYVNGVINFEKMNPKFLRKKFILCPLFIVFQTVFAQTNSADSYKYLGTTQGGASGLFVLSSPSVLKPGQIGFGVYYKGEIETSQRQSGFPLSLAYGLAERTEVFASFFSLQKEEQPDKFLSNLGLKLSLLQNQDFQLAADIQIQRIEQTLPFSASQELFGGSSKVIVSYAVGGTITGYAHLGYSWIEHVTPTTHSQVQAGAGLLFPLKDDILLGGELQTGQTYDNAFNLQANWGLKIFLFQHLQIAFGVQTNFRNDHFYGGLFLGISFVSQALQMDFSTSGDQSSALPEPPSLEELEKSKVLQPIDSDGDGLSDSTEINMYKTDPTKVDTDNDGLSDGEEALRYKTDPLKADTDGDGLSDGDEVMKYHTDPDNPDTDGGTVNDGVEVTRGTNPLDPRDDIQEKEIKTIEVATSIVFEGVEFKTGSSALTKEAEKVLDKVFIMLSANPQIAIEIRGHTDSAGNYSKNLKLSLVRAEAVKTYLRQKGVEGNRMTVRGMGSTVPVAFNETAEGRRQNRRVEFIRTQ